jgi:hypothetical protein
VTLLFYCFCAKITNHGHWDCVNRANGSLKNILEKGGTADEESDCPPDDSGPDERIDCHGNRRNSTELIV